MRRHENQQARPTAGCLSVPLFNQKKRNRVPLTSTPSESEFFSHSEYTANTPSVTPNNQTGHYGGYQTSGQSSCAPQRLQWNRQGTSQSTPPQQYGSNRPAPGPAPAIRNYAPMPHPYKGGGTSSKMGQPSYSGKQQPSNPSFTSGNGQYQAPHISPSTQSKPSPQTGFSKTGQQPSYRPLKPTQFSQQSRTPPAPVLPPSRPKAYEGKPQKNAWNFTSSFGPQSTLFDENRSTNRPQSARQTQNQVISEKPAVENSLRILTAVVDGMRHWSQFKDRVPYLFEVFATLDSAVTLGRHGAKNFLMRDGKQVVQCVFYENEQELPRLIRGQVHRCVGNYDRSRDVLVCMSVRPALPSELKNAREAVKVCDAEMRVLVKSLSEV
ncbi:LOW QUALITY PROTEIN: spermatogenesis-associated protein 22 [Xyrichtys novacula]|uniref:LOW QUALITY PROTEIN: spermatogenesis-associated protein 22 n=1 Tax=Xyrichtys novacula TaxID=13765 RepID=A0AAV1FS89_XYRNO|nr:LOW QUALITY PROTEIN: spermatogenesis-associated protein 22 [Xyrichtys novacula]